MALSGLQILPEIMLLLELYRLMPESLPESQVLPETVLWLEENKNMAMSFQLQVLPETALLAEECSWMPNVLLEQVLSATVLSLE